MSRRPLLQHDGIEIARDDHGVPHVRAPDQRGALWGLGWCHAVDRGMQMLLMRILGRGRLAETLDPSDAGVAVDTFFRRMNWSGPMPGDQDEALPPAARALLAAFCDGVNVGFARHLPWELRALGYRHSPWTIEDTVLMSRMAGYLTLAQGQGELERLIVELVQAGVGKELLEELFPGMLEGLDVALLREVTLSERIVPTTVLWGSAAPRMMSSNNWVVAGSRTASGAPILASDPHLEANRLPNVWYEVALHARGRYTMGATMPGIPAVLIGRNNDLAFGATYSYMDATDSWIERCRDGRFLRSGEWVSFRTRTEEIRRKGKAPVAATFHENEHGVLDGDPRREGAYLSTRWASDASGSRSLAAAVRMWDASTVEQGMALFGALETAWNWVLADRSGNIGYQMSGLLPRRRPGVSGLVALPGWDPANDWQGFHDASELPRALNPESGFFNTSNQDLNAHGIARPISVSQGSYRAERIAQLLAAGTRHTVEDMKRIQRDLYSLQAERFLDVLRPILPNTPQGRSLAEWDRRYDRASEGATLFERVYRELLREVFFHGAVGHSVGEHLMTETGVFADFFAAFDRVLLSERSGWFRGEPREALYRRAATRALEAPPRLWGESQSVRLNHVVFGGKLPRALGFDRGPIWFEGGRATPVQGQIYRSAGRTTSFVPSFRMVTDLSADACHTSLLGGPSDRRFSRWYASEVEAWVRGEYKVLKPAV